MVKVQWMKMIDFAKAFDTVPHKYMVYPWIEDSLHEQIQRTAINDSFSALSKVGSGVPQGPVLMLVLFSLFIIKQI